MCPRCGKTCEAELVEVSQFNNRFDGVPVGFEVAQVNMVWSCTLRPATSLQVLRSSGRALCYFECRMLAPVDTIRVLGGKAVRLTSR
jgi:hypothetical protein